MANLEQIASLLNIEVPKALGKKRRSWLQEDNLKDQQRLSSIDYKTDPQSESYRKGINKLDSKLDSTLDSNPKNLDSKLDSLDSTPTNLDSKIDSNSKSKLDSDLGSELDSSILKNNLYLLTGRQLEIFVYILRTCMKIGELQTGAMNTYKIAAETNTTYGTVKDALNKLIKKGLLIRQKGKTSSLGFINLSLSKEVKNLAIQLKLDSKLDGVLDSRLDSEIFSSSSSNINKTTTTKKTVEEINLKKLHQAFEKTPNKQFFGQAQLKTIIEAEKLTPEQIQKSILQFAYGLKNYSDQEPYSNMENPAAILFNHLKNGDVWTEPKYLTDEEDAFKAIYLNMRDSMEKNIEQHFNTWLKENKETKYEYYNKKFSSTSYYSDREYAAEAWKDYSANIWQTERKRLILELVGDNFNSLIDKIEEISSMIKNKK
jgi:predicted transcriptional regulator